jgi:large-conductance mechanosensitive channel
MPAFPSVVRGLENRLRFFFGLTLGIIIGKMFGWVVVSLVLSVVFVLIVLITKFQHKTELELHNIAVEELHNVKNEISEIKKQFNGKSVRPR